MHKHLGVLFNTDRLNHTQFVDYACRVESLGFDSLWLPELFTRDPYAAAGYLLANTTKLRIGTGIANIYGRDPLATVAASATLQDLSQGRFILGLGVSNVALNTARGHAWQNPVTKLAEYLEAMAKITLTAPQPDVPVLVAAHGPKMLACTARLADGANTYLMPLQHAEQAAAVLGSDKTLNTMLFCLDDENPDTARSTARKALAYYVELDYYHRAWRSFGFGDEDFSRGGSDRLIDALVAWGSHKQIRQRIHDQYQAGATHVVVIPLGAGQGGAPNWALLEALGT